MYERNTRRYGAFMVAFSLLLRLFMALGLDTGAAAAVTRTASDRDFARFLLYLETGQVHQVQVPQPQAEVMVLQVEPPAEEEQTPAEEEPALSLPRTLADPSRISIAGGSSYEVDAAQLLARQSSLDFSGPGPHILIVHTHGSEAYLQQTDKTYVEAGSFRTLDQDHSVIQVGQVLTRVLEAAGLSVIHDTSINDYPSYDTSYYNTLLNIQKWKEEYPGLQMVIDLHRDAVADGPVALSTRLDGQDCARLMLVVGTDEGGLSHPHWQENLANALKLQSVLEGAWPGLCRPLDLRTERFNQHMTPGSLLVEVGTNGNTLEEAERSARLLGEALVQMIGSLKTQNGRLKTANSG